MQRSAIAGDHFNRYVPPKTTMKSTRHTFAVASFRILLKTGSESAPEWQASTAEPYAASDAADSSEGFLHDYSNTKFGSCEISYQNEIEDAMIPVSVIYKSPPMESIAFERSCLSMRGWVLQERLLSQRILSFRSNRLQWECNKFCCSDDIHYPYIKNRFIYGEVRKQSINTLRDLSTALKYWYDIIITYSGCYLTKRSDKLPALSGIAQAFSKAVGDVYLAGLWKNYIHTGLTWYKVSPPMQRSYDDCNDSEESPTQYPEPSWSWACSYGRIQFQYLTSYYKKDLVIDSSSITLKGLDEFGEVSSGTLCVNGRINTASSDINKKTILKDCNTKRVIGTLRLDNTELTRKMQQDSTQQVEIIIL
ncbi:hypothetical protein EG329_014107 [Mollisiaceae sp. DMI_Dod_QoI]|nr:hypothetical protein EG329_014107 [Helotiales sp. DMI_Dod_QoI]